ncbi:MAG: Lrp/AsnC ligand binding domain-containing protein [archaeon]
MIGYILIGLENTNEQDILSMLLDNPVVKEGNILFGEWDIILKVETENPEALGAFVVDHVRNIPGIKLTSTLISAK